MLKKIEIDGYKSIDHQVLELQNFNLFAGVNSAGKSSIIQAISIVWQIICKWQLGEERVRLNFGKFSDVRNTIKGNKEINIQLVAESDTHTDCHFATSLYTEEGENRLRGRISDQEDWLNYTNQNRLIYLSVERVGMNNSYTINTENSYAIGDKGQYAYAYLALHGQDPLVETQFAYKPENIGMSLNNQVNYWLEYLLGFHVQVNAVPDLDQVVVTFANARDNHFYRAKNVGTGLSFVAMLLIATLSCHKGDTIMIENPEIHLHPRAQSRFMECMAYLSGRGLQIIIETHSDHIYNGMRKCIKHKTLSRDDVAAYYLELDEELQTSVCRIQFTEEGAEKNHPYGMFDQFDDDLDESGI